MARAKGKSAPRAAEHVPAPGDRERELCERVAALECENQALRHAAGQADLVREQFSDLYDYAPVGYLTIDEKGILRRVNLPAAALLGASREELVGTRLVSLVRPGEKTSFTAFLRSCFTTAVPIGIEVGLVRGKWRADWLQFVAAPPGGGRDLGHPGQQARLAVLDVSDRKRAEEALRESRDRYQAVVASMAEGVVVHDATGAIRECNTAAERILGLDADAITGRKSIDPRWRVIREDGRPFPGEEHPAMEVLRRGAPRWNVTMGVERPDGSLAWLRVNAEPLRGADGAVTGAVVTFADVTEARREEQELRSREAKLRAHLDTPAVGIAVTVGDTAFAEVNDRFCEMLGYGRAELLARSWTDVTHPDDVAGDLAAVRRMAAGEIDRFSREKRYVRRDGAIRWGLASVSCSRGQGGRIESIIAVVQDVTDRKAAEAALRRSELLHRTVASHFPGGSIGLFDADLRLVLLDGAGPFLGREPSALVGHRPSEVMPAGQARAIEEAFRRALDGLPGYAEVRRDGRVVELTTHPVPDEAGRGGLGLVMTEDVTDRRRMQEQLQVGSRLAALGRLVAGIAHEINNPLSGAMSGQALAIECLGELRERALQGAALDGHATALAIEHVVEALDDGLAGTLRIARIVKDLVTFGRPDPRRARIRLTEVVDDTIRWLAASIHARAYVRVEHAGGADVVASPGQVGQALVALVTNAVDAIPEGRRGIVTVRTGPGSPGMARLEVEDDGEGMAPEVLDRAFDPFFTTREVGKGMGLGLSVAHAIAAAHGGTLTAASQPGVGSTFRLEIPAAG